MELNWYGGADPLRFAEVRRRILSALQRGEDATVYMSGRHFFDGPMLFDGEFGGYSASVRFVCMPDCELDFSRAPAALRREGERVYARAEESGIPVQGKKVFRLARFPEEGYLRVFRADESALFSAFYFAEGEISEDLQAQGLWITIWPGGPGGRENWYTMTVPVKEIDHAAHRIVLEKPSCLLELGPGSRYYLQNDPSFLRAPGEYCVRRGEYVCVPYPGQEAVRISGCKSLLRLQGSAERPLRNFSFENFRLHGAAGEDFIAGEFGQYEGAVFATGTIGFSFSNGEIFDCSGHGICLYGYNENATVTGCHIARIGHMGIYAVAHDRQDFVSRGHHFYNNHIHDVGLCVGHGSGIQLLECAETRIENNRIHHSPRYAVSVLGLVSADLENGVLRSADERRREDIARAHDIVIARNDVFRCNLDSQDTGVIQAYYAGPNVLIEGNYVHDSDIPFSFGNGIYLDDCCKKFVVTGNYVARLQHGGGGKLSNAITAKGTDHHIFGNIFADNNIDPDGAAFSVMNLGDDSTLRLTCHSNAVIRSGENLYVFQNWADGRIAFSDFHLFEAPGIRVAGGYGVADVVPVGQWSRRDGFDSFSLCTEDAQFCAESGCFAPGSPARAFGIRDFDLCHVGLTERYAAERDIAGRLYLLCDGKYGESFEARPGQIIHFSCYAAGELNIPLPVDAAFEADDFLEPVGKGIYRALRKGVSTVYSTYGGFSAACKIYIGDEPASVSVRVSAREVEPKERFRLAVQAESAFGRVLSPFCVSLCVRGGESECVPFGAAVRADSCRAVTLTAFAGRARAQEKVSIRRRVLAAVECSADVPVLREGEKSGYVLRFFDRAGRSMPAQTAELADDGGGVVRVEDGQIVALRAGEAELAASGSVRSVSVLEKIRVRVVPAGFSDAECRSVDCFGRAFRKDGKLYLYSDGGNIWFRQDSFTAAGKEGRAVSVYLERIGATHPDSQAGVVLRGGWEPAAVCVNLRATAAGGIMVCMRSAEGEEIRYSFGMAAKLPVRLSLRRENGKVLAIVNGEQVWSAPDPFAKDTVAGAMLFSVNRTRCAEAVFSDLCTE